MLECSASFSTNQLHSVAEFYFFKSTELLKFLGFGPVKMESKGLLCCIVQSVCVLDILKTFFKSQCPLN